MTAAPGFDLAAEVSDAHAAYTLAGADYLDVSFSSGGLAFTTKWQPNALADVRARLTPLGQSVTLSGTGPRPWTVQVANSRELRTLLDGLRSGSRRLRWQPEDLGVFAAAAIWNYLTLPLLIQHAEQVHRLPDAEGARRLRITLPDHASTHPPRSPGPSPRLSSGAVGGSPAAIRGLSRLRYDCDSQLPLRRVARVGLVAAVGAGTDGVVEVPAKRLVVVGDVADRGP